ncbi:hypothetical protein [Spirosoma fluviale]|nr:hypothetical protein [Spirosoma fluviale]
MNRIDDYDQAQLINEFAYFTRTALLVHPQRSERRHDFFDD